MCRAAISECDIQEVCDGTSSLCPPDLHLEDGKACGNSSAALTCAGGICTSRDEQCRQRSTPQQPLYKYCPDSSDVDPCAIVCQDPTASNQCLVLSGQLLDGSECGMGGRCEVGVCKGSSFSKFFLLLLSLYHYVILIH